MISNHQIIKESRKEFYSWTDDFYALLQMEIVLEIIWKKLSKYDKKTHTKEMIESICGQFYELYIDGEMK